LVRSPSVDLAQTVGEIGHRGLVDASQIGRFAGRHFPVALADSGSVAAGCVSPSNWRNEIFSSTSAAFFCRINVHYWHIPDSPRHTAKSPYSGVQQTFMHDTTSKDFSKNK